MVSEPGRLDVIATPIGNLGDLSPRARAALSAANVIAAEDTRRAGLLLASCDISRPLISLHEHNEPARIQSLVERLRAGEIVALVSDAGTPLVSDPGFMLVRAAAAAGISVRAVPGPSALTAALSVAGLPTDRFAFEGFLPATAATRRRLLSALASETRTLVFFEAPHRIVETLADLAHAFGVERRAVIARELTKTYESIYRGTIAELAALAQADEHVSRGEMVLLIEGAARRDAVGDQELLAKAMPLLLAELPPARAASIASKLSGVPRAEAYELAMKLTPRER